MADYSTLELKELITNCKERGITLANIMSKAELVQCLHEHDKDPTFKTLQEVREKP